MLIPPSQMETSLAFVVVAGMMWAARYAFMSSTNILCDEHVRGVLINHYLDLLQNVMTSTAIELTIQIRGLGLLSAGSTRSTGWKS